MIVLATHARYFNEQLQHFKGNIKLSFRNIMTTVYFLTKGHLMLLSKHYGSSTFLITSVYNKHSIDSEHPLDHIIA